MDVEMRKIMSYGSGGDGTTDRAAQKKLLQVRWSQAKERCPHEKLRYLDFKTHGTGSRLRPTS
jgi:hypothetical protein